MADTWKAPAKIADMMESVKELHHTPRIAPASIALALNDSKPFIKNRFNWGSVRKFSDFNKLWQSHRFDFSITLCMDVWEGFLNDHQRHALLDLHLTRCEPVYEPETVIENGKKVVIKDDFGRVKFTDIMKTDSNGAVKWQVLPVDLIIFTQNVQRYGLWCNDLIDLGGAMKETDVVTPISVSDAIGE